MGMLGNLKLRVLLGVTRRLMRRGRLRVPRVRQLMQGDSFVLQIQTSAGIGGYFEVKDGDVALHYGLHEAPDFSQIWQSGDHAFRVLISGDETDMLRALEDGWCQMRGDFLRAMWFSEVMKLCRRA
jgi:hypothetical protein